MNDADKISILFIHETYRMIERRRLKFMPQIGVYLDMFCEPLPRVNSIIVEPSQTRLDELRDIFGDAIPYCVDAIISVG